MALPFLFNEKWYLDHNPDVARAVDQGLFSAQDHFQLYGQTEGRAPGPLFDPDLYLVQNPDVAAAVQRGETSAYEHFVNWGIDEERAPIALFDLDFYLLQNPDVAAAVQAGQAGAVRHFLTYGQGEPRFINPFIDLGAYLRANGDVANAAQRGDMSALEHLMLYGVHEGRDLGNGVTLDIFKNDAAFNQALTVGDAEAALQRMAAVAPFLPGFQPPANWAPAPDTPIVTDFTPPAGMKLVVPDGVIVPAGMVLPDVYEKPVVPDDGGGVPPTFTVHVASDDIPNIVTFGGSATGDIVLTIDDDGFGSFSRGGVIADATVPSVLSMQLQGSAATETLKLATALTGSQRLDFDGVGGGDKLVLADGGNALYLSLQSVAEVKGGADDDEFTLLNQADGLVIDGGGGGTNRVVLSYNTNEGVNSIRVRDISYVQGNEGTLDSVTLLDAPTAFRFEGKGHEDSLILSDLGNHIALTLSAVEHVYGGTGNDVMSLVNVANGLEIDGGGGVDRVVLADNGAYSVQLRSVEQVQGSVQHDTVTLLDTPSAFEFSGKSGDDHLILSNGNNNISLTLIDVEQVSGGSGDDVITIVSKNPGLTINGNAGNDRITAGAGADVIDGGDGDDTYVYTSANDSSILDEAALASGFDVVTVTAGDVFELNVAVASVTPEQVYIGAEPEVNGDALLGQLNSAFRSKKGLADAAVSEDGVDAMFISLGNNPKGRFLVVDIDADDQVTSADVIIELAGVFTTSGILSLGLLEDGNIEIQIGSSPLP